MSTQTFCDRCKEPASRRVATYSWYNFVRHVWDDPRIDLCEKCNLSLKDFFAGNLFTAKDIETKRVTQLEDAITKYLIDGKITVNDHRRDVLNLPPLASIHICPGCEHRK